MQGYVACGPVQRRPHRAQPVLGFNVFGPCFRLEVASDYRGCSCFSRDLWQSPGSYFVRICDACLPLMRVLGAYKYMFYV